MNKFFESERIIHSLKTMLACLIGFIITKAIKFPVDQWLIITILVVMCAQINVGSVLQKSYMRFLGTLAGSLIAISILLFFHNAHFSYAMGIALSALIFSYIATSKTPFSDAGTLGAATTVIILAAQHPTLATAGLRFLEISVGILIAALVSRFIFPIHAHDHLRRSQALMIRQLHDYYTESFVDEKTPQDTNKIQLLDEQLVNSLNTQRKLAKEANREALGKFDSASFKQLLWFEKEILRCMSLMRYALELPKPAQVLLYQYVDMPALNTFISAALLGIAKGLENKNFKSSIIAIPEFHKPKQVIEAEKHSLSVEDAIYMNAFLFFTETLLNHLKNLVSLINQIKKE